MARRGPLEEKKFNRLNDRFFKFVFANPAYKALLIEFLNEILANVPEGVEKLPPVVDIEYTDRESSPSHEQDKTPRFDVRATVADGRIVHIEVQLERGKNLLPRVLNYGARDYVFCTRIGEDYAAVQVICIVILGFTLFPKTNAYHTLHRILNVEDGSWHMRGMEFHFIEMSKLRKRRSGPKTGLERLLYCLGNIGGEETMQTMAAEDSRVAKIIELEHLFRSDPDLLKDYMDYEFDRWDYQVSMKANREEAWAEGLAKGRAEGRFGTLVMLVRDGFLPASVAAAQAQMPETEFLSRMANWEARS